MKRGGGLREARTVEADADESEDSETVPIRGLSMAPGSSANWGILGMVDEERLVCASA